MKKFQSSLLTVSFSRLGRLLPHRSRHLPFEFHIHRSVRQKYDIEDALFSFNGNVIIANFQQARILAEKINKKRDLKTHPELAVRPGQLNAMGLIDEINHYVLRLYEETINPKVFARSLDSLRQFVGVENLDALLRSFTTTFPPKDVYHGGSTPENFLNQSTEGKAHREITIEELILLYFCNFNPALAPFRELFDDEQLRRETEYAKSIERLELFFQREKPFGPEHQFIFDFLRAPILASPLSLEGQLAFMRERWGMLIGDKFLRRLLGARDLLKEDDRVVHLGGKPETTVPTYPLFGADGLPLEGWDAERFTQDIDWMPSVVLLAKNTYVWLDQLSKKYKRDISKLDQIPDEELDQIARWNFTSLWLIGIWERSAASRKIKQWTGNPEAVSSAYSIYDYDIAYDLGGEEAFQNLRNRAWARGIRLAGDMVPNHVGIFSRWVREHPDYFIQTSYPPYPNYQFTGGDLSDDPTFSIRIEDGYWSRRDAAVVFQRVDKRSGEVRYIYHGNDGTSMPWNDTAQLNFLRAEVREAVIQTIFHVARKFSVIRFDAAMTLAKRHFQRLWYPQPGSGGDIPSRADFALTKEEFDRAFPVEFWREVVDRINSEMPNTLLLAEAFWMLEGYFVRTLGMHRVYNSAFMNMLKNEENQKYREAIKNTLHFNPEILKRYVNFMSNPDEMTAIAQFGKDDKYFGVCTLMVTLPGLPMFAHGQTEGYTEKYGMEYRRAYYDEWPDEHLVHRHEREIFPLTKKRHLFSQVTNFELYDFVDTHGHVNQNVFAYSNMAGQERAVVLYHNKYEETRGWIRGSVGKTTSTEMEGGEKKIYYTSLGDALKVNGGDKMFYIFREHCSQLEFIRSGWELHHRGIYAELHAFQFQVFMDFREVNDATGDYERLAQHLNGGGVPDIEQAKRELALAPFHAAAAELFSAESIEAFTTIALSHKRQTIQHRTAHRKLLEGRYHRFVCEAKSYLRSTRNEQAAVEYFTAEIESVFSLAEIVWKKATQSTSRASQKPATKSSTPTWILEVRQRLPRIEQADHHHNQFLLLVWLSVKQLAALETTTVKDSLRPARLFDQLLIGRTMRLAAGKLGLSVERSREDELLLKILLGYGEKISPDELEDSVLAMLDIPEIRTFLRVNYYGGVWYYNKENFDEMIHWLLLSWLLTISPSSQAEWKLLAKKIGDVLEASDSSRYMLDELKTHLRKQSPAKKKATASEIKNR